MEKITGWGIAMENCGKFIEKALTIASENYLIDLRENKDETFQYIEIGVAEGRTFAKICSILDNMIDGGKYLATGIDIDNGWSLNLEDLYKNIRGYENKTILDLQGSPEALKRFKHNSVNAILIDGDHSFEAVIEDFTEADRIIKRGGIIMFHDSDPYSQSKDKIDEERQVKGIEVRRAIESLDLQKYDALFDYQPASDTDRGIYIIQRVVE